MGGARKKDPITGKCVLAPSDLNRVKRPTRKKRTPEEKAARLGAASKIAYTIRSSAKRSVLSQKKNLSLDVLLLKNSLEPLFFGSTERKFPVLIAI